MRCRVVPIPNGFRTVGIVTHRAYCTWVCDALMVAFSCCASLTTARNQMFIARHEGSDLDLPLVGLDYALNLGVPACFIAWFLGMAMCGGLRSFVLS